MASTKQSTAAPVPQIVGMTKAQRSELNRHKKYLTNVPESKKSGARREEVKTSPIIAGEVLMHYGQLFPQYGLLAENLDPVKPFHTQDHDNSKQLVEDNRILLNVAAPWSAFLCGSQGSGKSHTLSCILENCLLNSEVATVKNPLAGIVFHWDRFSSYDSSQICEAAYLVSAGIPIKVLVSQSNEEKMRLAYENLPGLPHNVPKPVVVPMLFNEEQLDVSRMLVMMGIRGEEKEPPLYMEVCSASYF